MRKAAAGKLEAPPMDMRLIGRGKKFADRGVGYKRQRIHDYLHSLYIKVTESLPEVAAGPDTGEDDPTPEPLLRFRRPRGKRPRIEQKQDSKEERCAGQALRYLPPGTYSDYHKLFMSENPEMACGLKLFMRAPCFRVFIY